ncbi:unnamed protein product, partial [Laminaria digitata]
PESLPRAKGVAVCTTAALPRAKGADRFRKLAVILPGRAGWHHRKARCARTGGPLLGSISGGKRTNTVGRSS